MKKVLLLGIALLLISSVASAQLPPWGYYGLFADEAHTYNCADGALFAEVHCYLFVKPGSDQLSCVEFGTEVTTGAPMVPSTVINADVVEPRPTGFINANILACFGGCYTDWVMFGDATIFVYPTVQPVVIELTPYPGGDYPKLLSCVGGIEYEGKVFTKYMLNTGACTVGDLETGVKESSWGAIKSLYE